MGYPGRQNIYEATIRRMALQALKEEDEAFRKAHSDDSDEALLDYLREWARRLRHTPWPGEIAGGSLIEERFGSWSQALDLAGLPSPAAPNQPKTFLRYQEEVLRQKALYRQRKAVKKALAQRRLAKQAARKKQP